MPNSEASILKTFSDKAFIDLEQQYADMLTALGLNLGRSRFRKSFDDYRKVSDVLEKSDSKIIPDDLVEDFRHATYDLSQLLDIYTATNDYPNKTILKDKFKKLNNGSASPSDEISSNSIARDTQFELKLYSDLIDSGITCVLDEPRPDIEVLGQEYLYAVECKRIFSDNDSKVSKRVGEARDQIKAYLEDNQEGIGIIAVDITRRLTGGNTYLRAKNVHVATARLNQDLNEFRKKFARFWTPNRIGDQRIVAVLLHASMYSYLEDRELASHASQVMIQNIYDTPWSNLLFKNALNDVFAPLYIHKTGELKLHGH